ncbi:MAG: UDP-N-acetylmuramoyl-L-alanine--D-glutamate ligase [Holophaga sp.]|nr:UDP-N-acetylmuramoyl-L-alanine--D-glutamate ligase [Holophaga sp.]
MGRIIVVGAGRSGLGAAEYLVKAGREVVVTESRPGPDAPVAARLAELSVLAVWGSHPLSLLDNCDEVVLSPGVPPGSPFPLAAAQRGISVIGELELAHRALRERADGSMLLAVTGTNGKSTTTGLVAHLLKACDLPAVACGNLGTPLITAMVGAKPATVYALECSSYQLETVRDFHAEGAAALNLTPDHLARHGTMEAYRATKVRIFQHQVEDDLRLTPLADPAFDAMAPGRGRSARFGWECPEGPGAWCDGHGTLWLKDEFGEHALVSRSQLLIPGDHNVENALAAAVLARHGGADLEGLRLGLKSYPGLAHRIALCGERNGIKAYNDSKGTNVDATLTAIRALPGPLVLLLGGQDKGSSYGPLRQALEGKLRRLVFLGEAIPQLERDLGDLPHDTIRPFDEAVARALELAQPGDQVLLSPACASFDQFDNFEQRGDHFEELVRTWAKG